MDTNNRGSDSTSKNDMRYFPRWEVKSRVSFHCEGDKTPHTGETKDMSCAGACITTDRGVTPHQKVKVSIEIADGVQVKLNGHIRWVRIENNQPQIGVTFYDTPDEVQNLILQHAFELDRQKVVNQWYKGWAH